MLLERALDFLRLSHQDGKIERIVPTSSVCAQAGHYVVDVFYPELYFITLKILSLSNSGTRLFQVIWLRTTAGL